MLMTDIEDSTGLVQQLGARYRQLIDEVWSILRRGVADSGGHEVEARADEFFAVFESPRSAVDAAVALQLELIGRSWIDDLAVRVRIGIHSGYPTSTDSNYVGMDVNTASRITAVGHGGQVVVSANTREGVMASAPNGVRFKALGEHKLRGLPDPVALFQVAAKGLPSRFPPLRKS
jgi:class 3 adenylate cyclase